MSNFHSEQHLNNKLAVSTLKNISKEQAMPYSKIKKYFSEGDVEIAKAFWIMLRKNLPNHQYNSAYFCPDCKKFDLEEKGHKVPW
jgi:hypothetical protein